MKTSVIYLMKNNTHPAQTKFGYRTNLCAEETKDEVNGEYIDFECFATYNLGTNNLEDTEFIVKRIRIIINTMAGNLENAKPEYYNIPPAKALKILTAIVELRGNIENLIEWKEK